MSTVRKRKGVTVPSKGSKGALNSDRDEGSGKSRRAGGQGEAAYPEWMLAASAVVGVGAMVYCGYLHSWYMYTIHENNMWFTNIKEVEREISFRTESGLYYSYFKQVVQAPSISQGVHDLMYNRHTEYPDTINVLERMNIYQELFLAAVYRILPSWLQEDGILFYIKSVFALHGLLIAALFSMTWMLSKNWLAGALAAAFYIFNRLDTTRVEYTIPLRECFALPFLWLQGAALTYYFNPRAEGWKKGVSVAVVSLSTCLFWLFWQFNLSTMSVMFQGLSVAVVSLSTCLFCLFWQFNQFIMMLQAFALFGVWVLDVVPPAKVRTVLLVQLASLLAVCLLQFGNMMIMGSLALSFIPASLLLIMYRGDGSTGGHWLVHAGKVVTYSVLAIALMLAINILIKFVIQVEADEHIFKFLQNKFSSEEVRDFDSLLYLCMSIFGFLTMDVYERLTKGLVLPFYVVAHTAMLLLFLVDMVKHWRSRAETCLKVGCETETNDSHKVKDKPAAGSENLALLRTRPELLFHVVQCVFFGALAMTTLRMKYLWTPYMCVLAAVAVGDAQAWTAVLSACRIKRPVVVDVCRHLAVAAVLVTLVLVMLPGVYKELEELREFYDPDTVQLMEWIQNNTAPMASFTGSMQLMAGVKLCTGRPVNNHPHYEDKALRHKTKQLYQVYGRRSPEDVHAILTELRSHYIILEDSICRAPARNNCRTPDIVDLDNGVIPDGGEKRPGLKRSTVPRFCEEVRHQTPQYAKYFKTVFINNTFRIYRVI